jgi:hypothetical protein
MASTADVDTAAVQEVKDDAEAMAGDQVRRTIADVYTFVRSCDINKTISGFTFDHYIDEAKRRIKEPKILRSAADPSKGVGTRSGQLEALTKLEEEFNKTYEQAKKLAEAADVGTAPASASST